MSANNCTLIKQHGGEYLVFENVMAESWGDGKNELNINDSVKCASLAHALVYANSRDDTEYGVCGEFLPKDGAGVTVVENELIEINKLLFDKTLEDLHVKLKGFCKECGELNKRCKC